MSGHVSVPPQPVAACCHVSVPPQPVAAGPTTRRSSNVPPPLTAASPAATGYGGMCDVSLGQRAATVVLTFALRGGLFWHFTGTGGLICQNFYPPRCKSTISLDIPIFRQICDLLLWMKVALFFSINHEYK
jgi:hypothetical protein